MIMEEVNKAPANFEQSQTMLKEAIENKQAIEAIAAYKARHTTLVKEYKVGRNDKCPCGSGKKYKDCCMRSQKYEHLVPKVR